MKILVLLKETPDTETKIKLTPDNKKVDETGFKYIINPYDEYAVEEALKYKDKDAAIEVVICSFGTEASKERMIKALAMGADRGILINNKGIENLDSLGVAKILAAVVKQENPDLVMGGKQAIDDDNMHGLAMVAELMGWPHINVVNKVELNGSKATIERTVEGGQIEVYEAQLPLVLGADKALNSPRYASLPGIMKAKKKPFDVKTSADYGITAETLLKDTKVSVLGYEYPKEKPPGKIFKGEDVGVMVEKLAKLLREEAKII